MGIKRQTLVAGFLGFCMVAGVVSLALLPALTAQADDRPTLAGSDQFANVEQADPADADTDDDTKSSTRADKLRSHLQEMVDDGTITAEQADAVVAHIQDGVQDRAADGKRGDRQARRGGKGQAKRGGAQATVLLDALGMTRAELRSALTAGDDVSIADVAEANGVDPQTVIDALVKATEERIDQAVAAEKLTVEEADAKRADLVENVTERINSPAKTGRK